MGDTGEQRAAVPPEAPAKSHGDGMGDIADRADDGDHDRQFTLALVRRCVQA